MRLESDFCGSLLPLSSGPQVIVQIESASSNIALESPPLKADSTFRRHIMLTMFSWLLSWSFNGGALSITIDVLRVRTDDSKPHILPLQTINASAERNVNCCVTCIPDMRPFWGTGEGWKGRDVVQCMILILLVYTRLEESRDASIAVE
jgi:hypothetical protein